jgi:hypothetical protein
MPNCGNSNKKPRTEMVRVETNLIDFIRLILSSENMRNANKDKLGWT